MSEFTYWLALLGGSVKKTTVVLKIQAWNKSLRLLTSSPPTMGQIKLAIIFFWPWLYLSCSWWWRKGRKDCAAVAITWWLSDDQIYEKYFKVSGNRWQISIFNIKIHLKGIFSFSPFQLLWRKPPKTSLLVKRFFKSNSSSLNMNRWTSLKSSTHT